MDSVLYSPADDLVLPHFGQSLSIVPPDSANIIVCLCVKYLHLHGSIAYSHRYRHPKSRPEGLPNTLSVFGWFGTRVTCDMVSDGGGRFIPAGMVGLHTLSLLLASLVAHDRATEDNHRRRTHRKEATTEHYTILVGSVHKLRQGGINSVPL